MEFGAKEGNAGRSPSENVLVDRFNAYQLSRDIISPKGRLPSLPFYIDGSSSFRNLQRGLNGAWRPMLPLPSGQMRGHRSPYRRCGFS